MDIAFWTVCVLVYSLTQCYTTAMVSQSRLPKWALCYISTVEIWGAHAGEPVHILFEDIWTIFGLLETKWWESILTALETVLLSTQYGFGWMNTVCYVAGLLRTCSPLGERRDSRFKQNSVEPAVKWFSSQNKWDWRCAQFPSAGYLSHIQYTVCVCTL